MIIHRFVLSLLALSAFNCAAFAQNPIIRAPQTDGRSTNLLTAQISNAERTQDADALLLAYGQAVTDAELARTAIAQLLASYYAMRNGAQTAEQATQAVAEANLRFQVLQAAQNQIMVQQNQQLLQQNAQIIALLQQQVRPR